MVENEDKYGIGVYVEGGGFLFLNTFGTKKELVGAYRMWKKYSTDKKLDSPLPVGLAGKIEDKNGKVRVLKDLL